VRNVFPQELVLQVMVVGKEDIGFAALVLWVGVGIVDALVVSPEC
jgi:hypothetical protein